MAIKLGDKAKDKISGFTGTVTSHHKYLNGCERLSITPNELKDGKPIDAHTFDIEQIELVQADQHPMLKPTGGPESEPARASIPSR